MTGNLSGDDARTPAGMDDLRLGFPPGGEPPFRTPVGEMVATAVRRGRRRRIARVSAKAVLFALPAVAAIVVVGNIVPGTATTAVGPASSPSGTPSTAVAVCTAAQLSGTKSSRAGAGMSNTFAEIIVTNSGPGSCQLSGYPKLAAWGAVQGLTGPGPRALLPTVLTRGSTYLILDPGPTTVVIPPGGHAWFGVGAGTGYASPQVVLDTFVIELGSLSGGRSGHVNVAVAMAANGPPGKAIPVTVTAFAPGVPPKQ